MKSLPKRIPLNELHIHNIVHRLKIKHFRGVFMRDNLPKTSLYNECAVVNLDSIKNDGTHWTAYCKKGKHVFYFDSFGNLPPPIELVKYFGSDAKINYNYSQHQEFDTSICGQLCIVFLQNFSKKFFR